MPDRSNIEHFVTRMLADPVALVMDADFARAYHRLPAETRNAVIAAVTQARAHQQESWRQDLASRWRDARSGAPVTAHDMESYRRAEELEGQRHAVDALHYGAVRPVRPPEHTLDRVNRPVRPPSFVTMNIDDVVAERRAVNAAENRAPIRVTDESAALSARNERRNGAPPHATYFPSSGVDEVNDDAASYDVLRAARIDHMRRDMAREIDEFRSRAVEAYQRRPAGRQTTPDFQAWSAFVERGVASIRGQWEQQIAQEQAAAPAPPVVTWPDPADYGPNCGYRSQRGALSAFTRAVNATAAGMRPTVARDEARDQVHINGTLAVRRAWNRVPIPQAARTTRTGEPIRWAPGLPPVTEYNVTVPPPPTTQPWHGENAPEVDETDLMIKHLPRSGNFVVITPSIERATDIRHKMDLANISIHNSYVLTIKSVANDIALLDSLRNIRAVVFIDPTVFKMHTARQGDWSEADLDAIIELQGQIPDEEAT